MIYYHQKIISEKIDGIKKIIKAQAPQIKVYFTSVFLGYL